ncbi:amidohydrolase family protein [Sediminibacillus massiliensis]|uniref:amidohydrolase family protein n=1 Tax=Sediminibacillus massiliensis TaxID=1926277 RepID=UPI0015C3D4C9|nr:amidohydrolase family protein [Sediminibacillus massiliensis]
MKVDSHQHYWTAEKSKEPVKGSRSIEYLPKQLKPLLESAGIEKTIAVQASPSEQDNEFLLNLTEKEDTIAGVVGWLDMAAENFAERLEYFRQHPKFVGVRPMIQDLPSEWIVGEKVIRNMKLLADKQFPLDLQANPRHLKFVIQLLQEVPHLRAVIDHLAKPPIKEGLLEPWAAEMKIIASYPNMRCKLSGMVPEVTDAPWSAPEIQPFADVVIEVFGKERVMFGSDWPVCLRSATHQEVIDLVEELIADRLTSVEKTALYSGNAIHFYKLNVKL